MEITKLIILLCCIYNCYTSQHSHIIPIEGYETELQNLGQHVEVPETPVKVIKITKTIAVKIPVPYPVKVKEKVPYPVQVIKPYPVPVPHIIKVPHAAPPAHGHDQGPAGEGLSDVHNAQLVGGPQDHTSYQVQEGNSYDGGNSGHGQNIEHYEEYPSDEGSSNGGSYVVPEQSFYGNGNSEALDGESFESKSYDQAIQEYLQKHSPNAGNSNNHGFYKYH